MNQSIPQKFIFNGYELDHQSNQLVMHYSFLNGAAFSEKIIFPAPLFIDTHPLYSQFIRAIETLYILAGVSYYKLYCPSDLDLNGMNFHPDQISFFEKIYKSGLAEFAYRNHINIENRINFTNYQLRPSQDFQKTSLSINNSSLVLIGGGKDSLVSVEVMAAAEQEFDLFVVNAKPPMIECAMAANKELIECKRVIDPLLFDANRQDGALNGHVPITAIVSMLAIITALLLERGNVILSNERSADEPTLVDNGKDVNHQYSKSTEFETDLQHYLQSFVTDRVQYFSLLRPLSELHIAHLFARVDKYDKAFTSCNKAFRINNPSMVKWCGECAKCNFTFLMMATIMPLERLLNIFPKNLLDTPESLQGFKELMGLDTHKPWDCVGEARESMVALYLLSQRAEWKDKFIVRELSPYLDNIESELREAYTEFLTPQWQGALPDQFKKVLKNYVE